MGIEKDFFRKLCYEKKKTPEQSSLVIEWFEWEDFFCEADPCPVMTSTVFSLVSYR